MGREYVKLEKIGSGSYGAVYKGREVSTNKYVAMKKVNIDLLENGFPKSYLREMSLLKSLQHENVVRLVEIVWKSNEHIYLIFEYMLNDLRTYMNDYEPNGLMQRPGALKSYFYQITKGVEFCHMHSLLHRDIKPENVLIDCDGNIKIADFGLSRTVSVPLRGYTTNVVTLWYRAPELLFGAKYYACSLDVWSLGCIFAEMGNGRPLFIGDSEIDQAKRITAIMGTPDEAHWPGVTHLRHFNRSVKGHKGQQCLQQMVNLVGPALELLEAMLTLNPNKRISAKQALKHKFFDGFDPNSRYPPLQIESPANQ